MAPSKHILLTTAFGWGHIRPLISLASKLVHLREDLLVTFTVTGSDPRLDNEVDRYFNENEQALKENIRFLDLGAMNTFNPVELFGTYMKGFAKVYPAIYKEEEVTCATGRVYPPTFRPSVILVDPFYYEILQAIREVSGKTVPVLAWNTGALTAMLRWFGPQSLGGAGNLPLKAETLAKETGRPANELYSELYQPEAGEVIKLPGMPAMYDYEFIAQHLDPRIVAFQFLLFSKVFYFFEDCDGYVALGNTSFEPEICAATRTWFSPRPAYFIGPLLPDETSTEGQLSKSQEKELAGSPDGAEIKAFLDTIQKSHGDYSLLYISWGSNFFPTGEGVWKLLETVLETKIPLILSHNAQKSPMPSHLQEKFKASEIALVTAWAPQHVILGHRATGWFLTHCGNNSVIESVSYGIPMIAFPLGGDQPFNAAYISSTLNIAYELYETRLGSGLRPLHRGIQPKGTLEAIEQEVRSVLSKAQGSDGAEKRRNVHALKKKLDAAWTEGGEAREDLIQFLNKFVPAN